MGSNSSPKTGNNDPTGGPPPGRKPHTGEAILAATVTLAVTTDAAGGGPADPYADALAGAELTGGGLAAAFGYIVDAIEDASNFLGALNLFSNSKK